MIGKESEQRNQEDFDKSYVNGRRSLLCKMWYLHAVSQWRDLVAGY